MAWLGFFYGGNIAGAVLGCLLAGFYLLSVLRHVDRHLCRGGAERLVAAAALLIAGLAPSRHPSRRRQSPTHCRVATPTRPARRLVYVAIALSGLTALASEVLWTRLLSLLFGATTYTFSLILAVFLAGLGLGSSVGAASRRDI